MDRDPANYLWKKCPAPGCSVRFHSLKCEKRKYCSVPCARKNHKVKTKGWHWKKNIEEVKVNTEEKGEHRKTIFTAGERGEDKVGLESYSEGEVL